MTHEKHPIAVTQSWLKTIIIDYGICPFAQREFERGSIHYCVTANTDIETALLTLVLECERLETEPTIETTLLIFPDSFAAFDDYLDLLELAETLLYQRGYEGVYQLASFHPDYCFEGAKPDDAANYTNRSPYPMLHLLREASIEHALKHYPNPENIPQLNIELTRQLGLEKMKTLLQACYLV
jgi:hypothetical protein